MESVFVEEALLCLDWDLFKGKGISLESDPLMVPRQFPLLGMGWSISQFQSGCMGGEGVSQHSAVETEVKLLMEFLFFWGQTFVTRSN